MENKRKSLIITLLSIIIFIFGVIGILVWVVNMLSQNTAMTSKLITSQIHRLLDLESEVENPHAYVDWDLHYKIRADKLTFIHENEDLISVEDLKLNIFLPYFALKRIYITQMNGENLYVNFERTQENKLNIAEIFDISGFFKVYFRNSSISINKYFFKFTDNFQQPSQKMIITGDNILLSKFTLNKYMQLIMDGNIAYNKSNTPFSLNYNMKYPIKNKDFNFEINLPKFDVKTFKAYQKEFLPNFETGLKGDLKIKTQGGKYFAINGNIEDIEFWGKNFPLEFDFDEKVSISTGFEIIDKDIAIDSLQLVGKDFDVSTYGRLFDVTKLPLTLDLNIKIANNSNGQSLLKLLPMGIPVMGYAINDAKNFEVGGILNGQVHAKGTIGQLLVNGQINAEKFHLGYGKDLPEAGAELIFKNDKMFLNGIYYPNHDQKQFIKISGDVKITKPFVLNLDVESGENMDLSTVQRALKIYSEIFNFKIGPVAIMDIKQGRGKINLKIQGTPPNVFLYGKMDFQNGIATYPGLNGILENIVGEVNFEGKDIYYNNISGYQNGIKALAKGKTQIHKNGLTHFYLDIPSAPLDYAQTFINNSPLIEKVSTALNIIQKPLGEGALNLVLESDKDSIEPYAKGQVRIKNGSCNIEGLAYRAENISGKVDFDTYKSFLDLKGIINGENAILSGEASQKNSKIIIETPNTDVLAAYEFIYNSPLFADMKDGFNDFSEFNGKIKTQTILSGDLSNKNEPDFYTTIDIIQGKLRYLDIKEDIILNSGRVIAQQDKLLFNNLQGTVAGAPFRMDGITTNIGTPNEKPDLKIVIHNLDVKNVAKIIDTKLLEPEVNELLKKFTYTGGLVNITAYVEGLDIKTHLDFYNASACYKESGENILIKSGEFIADEENLEMKNLAIQMSNSDILIDGTIKNYQKNPLFDINFTSNIEQKDFNNTLARIFNIPLTLNGRIYTNVDFRGDINNWHIKTRAMLNDNSYIFYKGASIGEGLSKFMFFDVQGIGNDIIINTFDVLSPKNTTEQTKPEIIAQVKGEIKGLQNEYPIIKDLDVKFNDYMNISFLNILFYDPIKPKPLLQNGFVKGELLLNGPVNNMEIIGNTVVKEAIIPSINTTIEKMDVNFKKDFIEIDNAQIDLAGAKATIKAVLENNFLSPVKIKNMELSAQDVNIDKIIQSFSNLFAKEKSNSQNPFHIPAPPVVIQNGNIDIKNLVYSSLPVQNLSAQISFNENWILDVKNILADITGGTVNGNMKYNIYSTDLAGKITVDNVTSNVLASTFLNLPNEVSGEMDANIEFTTKGKNHTDIIQNLNGLAHFKLYKGRMLRLGSIEYMLRIANTFKGGLARLNLNAIVNLVAPKTGYFDTVEGDINIQDGLILTDAITFKSSELNLFLTGSYNMNNSIVNATLIGQMPIESKESILWLGPLGKISLNSLMKQLLKEAKKEIEENNFFRNPMAYLNAIPGLSEMDKDYRFFVVSLDGNLYTEKYVDKFRWIK